MGIQMEALVFFIYAAVIMTVYFFGRKLLVVTKYFIVLMVNSIIGMIFILFINLLGQSLGILIPVNWLTILIAGVLGVPGILTMILYFNVLI